MDSTQLTLLALGLGTIIGGSVVAVIFLALGARNRAHAQASMAIPDGVREVLGGMDDAAVVVAPSFLIVAASAPAAGFGMQQGGTLTGDSLRALVRAARSTDRAESETLRLQREVAPATPRLVIARASVISPRLTLVVVRDITERERVEEMRRDFVSNTSHELKTPVGAITLLAEAVESAADDPDQVRKFAARLSAEAGRLGNLTSRIMSLSRLQASVEVTNDRDVAIDEIVTSAIESHAVEAESAWITIVRGGERGLYVRGDVQVLSDAVGNLIANAIAYSPAGGEVGVGREGGRWGRGDRRDRPGHRDSRGRAAACVRAVLPCGPGAFSTDRRYGPRARHRQARRAAARRTSRAVVASWKRLDIHHPPTCDPGARRPGCRSQEGEEEAQEEFRATERRAGR